MRITECYIEAFGALKKKRFLFNDGLNVICEDNGSGKTTLAAFIRAMLYGIGDTKRSSVLENERKRYLPWSGDRCAGSLTFVYEGRQYRIERVFGKRASEDDFRVIDTALGRESDKFTEKLGEELFGIDAEGFERTVLLSEKRLSPECDNKSIAAKLSDLVSADGDIGMLDTAYSVLDAQRRFYFRKGGAGEIRTVREALGTESARLDEAESAKEKLSIEQERLKGLKREAGELAEELGGIDSEIARLGVMGAREGHDERQREAKAELSAAQDRRDELFLLLGASIPSYADIGAAEAKAAEAETLGETVEKISAEEEELRGLSDGLTYKATEEELGEVRHAIYSIKQENGTPKKHTDEALFKRRRPEEDEIKSAICDLRAESSLGIAAVLLLSLLFGIVGAVIGYTASPVFYVGTALGILMLTVLLPIMIGARSKRRRMREERLSRFFISVLGEDVSDDKEKILHSMLDACKDGEKSTREAEILIGFVRKFDTRVGLDEILAAEEILSRFDRIKDLERSIRLRSESLGERQRAAIRGGEEAKQFLRYHGIKDGEGFSLLRARLDEYSRLTGDIARLGRQIESRDALFGIGENDGDSIPEKLKALGTERDRINARQTELQRDIAHAERRLEEYSDLTYRIEEITARRERLIEKEREYSEDLEAIKLAEKYLAESSDAISHRYLGTTKAGFEKYVHLMGGGEESFEMNTEFGVSRVDGGASHSAECYSRGERELYAFATRLGLIDALYPEEQPPILLDDPFTALDDKRCKRAIDLLADIAKRRQIIYLTASEIRAPEGLDKRKKIGYNR